MTTAILEILVLLTVSCVIGMVFTYLFWRSKYRSLKEANQKAEAAASEERSHAARLQQSLETKQAEVAGMQKELESAKETTVKPQATRATKPSKVDEKQVKELKAENKDLQDLVGEKERELEVLSKELQRGKISYYRYIDGNRYKALTLQMADEAVAGQGDGRISMEDARKVFATISDGKAYTQVEKDTMRYLRLNYNWTEGADELFRKKVRSWAAKGHVLDAK